VHKRTSNQSLRKREASKPTHKKCLLQLTEGLNPKYCTVPFRRCWNPRKRCFILSLTIISSNIKKLSSPKIVTCLESTYPSRNGQLWGCYIIGGWMIVFISTQGVSDNPFCRLCNNQVNHAVAHAIGLPKGLLSAFHIQSTSSKTLERKDHPWP